MPISLGTIVASRYRVERLLGQSGMGYAVLARDTQVDQQVVLKFMHAGLATQSPAGAARFLDEARAAARIRSDHVVRVSVTGTFDDGSPYMVMEYLEGQDLEALLQERRSLPVSIAIDYAMQASEGLGEVHAAGIVHRDLKPSNLFLARQPDGSVRVKLLDPGISKMAGQVGPADIDAPGSHPCGSPLYMAPEQMRSPSSADEKVDIWSLGVVLYEMLAASPPFVGNTVPAICARVIDEPAPPLRALRAELPDVLEAAVMQCLEKDPKRRFQSVTAVARALAPFGGPDSQAIAIRIKEAHERGTRGAASAVSGPSAVLPRMALTRTPFKTTIREIASVVRPAEVERTRSEAPLSALSAPMSTKKALFSKVVQIPILRRVRAMPLIVIAAALTVGMAIVMARTGSSGNPEPRATQSENATPAGVPGANPTPIPLALIGDLVRLTPIPSETPMVTAAPALSSAGLRPAPPVWAAVPQRKPAPARAATSDAPPVGTSSAPPVGTSSAAQVGTGSAAPIGTGGFGARE